MADRRTFLSNAALAGAASSLVASLAPEASAAQAPRPDQTQEGVLTEAGIVSLLRANAKYKQLFAAAPLQNGIVTHYMYNSLQAVEHGYLQQPGAMQAAAVLYGSSILQVLQDDFWQRYVTDGMLARFHEKLPARKGNPFLHPASEGNPARPDAVLPLVGRGSTFFVCANALAGLAAEFAKDGGIPADGNNGFDVLRTNLIREAHVVPAGVACVMTLQQQGFTFFQASIATA
jgi:intracellular sulfur oxidation DsrE/DsrF family protein